MGLARFIVDALLTCKLSEAKELTIFETDDKITVTSEYGEVIYEDDYDYKFLVKFQDLISKILPEMKCLTKLTYQTGGGGCGENVVVRSLSNHDEGYRHFYIFLKKKPKSLIELHVKHLYGISPEFLDGIECLYLDEFFHIDDLGGRYLPSSLKFLSIGFIIWDRLELVESFENLPNLAKLEGGNSADVFQITRDELSQTIQKISNPYLRETLLKNLDQYNFYQE